MCIVVRLQIFTDKYQNIIYSMEFIRSKTYRFAIYSFIYWIWIENHHHLYANEILMYSIPHAHILLFEFYTNSQEKTCFFFSFLFWMGIIEEWNLAKITIFMQIFCPWGGVLGSKRLFKDFPKVLKLIQWTNVRLKQFSHKLTNMMSENLSESPDIFLGLPHVYRPIMWKMNAYRRFYFQTFVSNAISVHT